MAGPGVLFWLHGARPPSVKSTHNFQRFPDARLLLAVAAGRRALAKMSKVFVACERTIHGDRLPAIPDWPGRTVDRLRSNGETTLRAPRRGGRQQRGEHLDRSGLAGPVGAEQAEDLTSVDR